ncbi:hypothetical protein CTI12_AA137790 [Artemisia annua]|uniref:Uncharacterized protein n=1 Tax=Artemisia annua TaxID=35608 RepID=A0A2U1PM19_ARTAN|nr:hypothetical protein CTI12_AA137790 [Artemisia annua]
MLIQDTDDHVRSIISETYPHLKQNLWSVEYFQERAILAPTHEMVDMINDRMLDLLEGDETLYQSSDSLTVRRVDDNSVTPNEAKGFDYSEPLGIKSSFEIKNTSEAGECIVDIYFDRIPYGLGSKGGDVWIGLFSQNIFGLFVELRVGGLCLLRCAMLDCGQRWEACETWEFFEGITRSVYGSETEDLDSESTFYIHHPPESNFYEILEIVQGIERISSDQILALTMLLQCKAMTSYLSAIAKEKEWGFGIWVLIMGNRHSVAWCGMFRTHFSSSSANGLVLCSAYSAFLPKDEALLTPFPQEASTDPQDNTVTLPSKKKTQNSVTTTTTALHSLITFAVAAVDTGLMVAFSGTSPLEVCHLTPPPVDDAGNVMVPFEPNVFVPSLFEGVGWTLAVLIDNELDIQQTVAGLGTTLDHTLEQVTDLQDQLAQHQEEQGT